MTRPSEQLDIGYANEMMALFPSKFDVMTKIEARMKQTRRLIWIVYLGLAAHVGFVLFWAGLQGGWWQ